MATDKFRQVTRP